jgi:L-serine/L-threonine ammonia-lyase
VACVYAAQSLGHPATVVVPVTTKPLMIAKIRAAGAHDVIQHGANWKEADTYLREELLARDPAAVYVPPFDHPDIWRGHATILLDAAAQLGGARPDAIVCSVGGGGLMNGIMEGMDQVGWGDVPLLACETQGADSLAKSLQAGEHITLDGITSQATSLGAVRVSPRTYELAQRPSVKSVVLSDAEAAMGCWRLADDERLVVELACGVNVALCYGGRLERAMGKPLSPDSKILIILCGGGNVTLDMLVAWKSQFGYIEKTMPHGLPDVPSSVTTDQ